MACDNLLQKWLLFYDPIHRGFTPKGIANGGMTTVGWSFPRIRGGFNLYRGTPTAGDIDYDYPVGAAGHDAVEIRNFSWRNHSPDTDYFYGLRAINGGGCESAISEPLWPARFDPAVNMFGDPPNSPEDLQISLLSGGRFKLQWTYREKGQFAPPAEFRLYHDSGSGTVDYGTVRGTTKYRPSRLHFEFESGAFGHDAKREWSVRAATALGVEDDNTATAISTADAQGPPNHPTAFAECGPET